MINNYKILKNKHTAIKNINKQYNILKHRYNHVLFHNLSFQKELTHANNIIHQQNRKIYALNNDIDRDFSPNFTWICFI